MTHAVERGRSLTAPLWRSFQTLFLSLIFIVCGLMAIICCFLLMPIAFVSRNDQDDDQDDQ